jgi:hypothetical protein
MTNSDTGNVDESTDPYISFFDNRFAKTKETLIFMEETKIWQELLENCTYKAGPNAIHDCRGLFEIVQERLKYYNSKYQKEFRPSLSPGIDPKHEK